MNCQNSIWKGFRCALLLTSRNLASLAPRTLTSVACGCSLNVKIRHPRPYHCFYFRDGHAFLRIAQSPPEPGMQALEHNPAVQIRRVHHRQATLSHHLHESAHAELEAQGSSHAQLAYGTGPKCPAGGARRRWPAGRLRATALKVLLNHSIFEHTCRCDMTPDDSSRNEAFLCFAAGASGLLSQSLRVGISGHVQ